jgi:hypothetical protein
MNELPFSYLTPRELWLTAGLLLVFVLLTGLLIGPRNRLSSRGNADLPIDTLSKKPILQLELARNADDVKAILQPGDMRKNIADARAGNWFDLALFIPAYSMLFLCLALLSGRALPGHGTWIFRLALVLIIVIAAADYMEDIGIHRVLDLLASGAPVSNSDALRISTPGAIKWLLLTVLLCGLALANFFPPFLWHRVVLAIALGALGLGIGKVILPYLGARFT